jgi:hypothetical protein
MGERTGAYRALVGKLQVKRPLGRRRRRWEENSKMGLQKNKMGVWNGLIWLRMGTSGRLL